MPCVTRVCALSIGRAISKSTGSHTVATIAHGEIEKNDYNFFILIFFVEPSKQDEWILIPSPIIFLFLFLLSFAHFRGKQNDDDCIYYLLGERRKEKKEKERGKKKKKENKENFNTEKNKENTTKLYFPFSFPLNFICKTQCQQYICKSLEGSN